MGKIDSPWDNTIWPALQKGLTRTKTGAIDRQKEIAGGLRGRKSAIEGADTRLGGMADRAKPEKPKPKRPPTMSDAEYKQHLEASFHNKDAPEGTLGKYKVDGTESYVDAAERRGDQYFSMGDNWGTVQSKHGLDDKQMFELFNVPFLDRLIDSNAPINFSHNPNDFPGSALHDELQYLTKHGYEFDPTTMRAER